MIGDNIRRLRLKNGFTQKELAEKLFVTGQAVSRWENGDVEPSLGTIAEMSKLFNVQSDEILGIEHAVELVEDIKEKEEPVITEEKKIEATNEVRRETIAFCSVCHKPIYDPEDIVERLKGSRHEHISCQACETKRKEQEKKDRINDAFRRRKHAYIYGSIGTALFVIAAIVSGIITKDYVYPLICSAFAIIAFTFISCCILDNTFIGEFSLHVFSWGFVKMPGIIFSLDFDGLIFLVITKILLSIFAFLLAAGCAALAFVLGGVMSLFAYPVAISRNYKHPAVLY
ncbi:MAG: helix-turn-helix transcriptional regulator [Bacilli bacterium]